MTNQPHGFIYSLSDPRTAHVKYIGQTINVEKRYNLHLFHSKQGRARTHKEKWINGLLNDNLKPEINILWQGDVSLLDQKEIEYIALFKSFGAKLTNATLGGLTTRGRKCSEETKLKFREMFTGKLLRPPITEEEKRKASERQKNFKHTEASKKKLSIARKGKPSHWSFTEMPEHFKRNISEIGRKTSKGIFATKDGIEVYYPSTVVAEKETGCDRKTMRQVANGTYKQCKGYIFRWV